MSEKVFELVGKPKVSIVWKGLVFEPNKNMRILVNEKELNFYSQFVEIQSVKEHKDIKEEIAKESVAIDKQEQPMPQTENIVQKPKPTQTSKPKTSTTTKPKSRQSQSKTVKRG